MIPGQCLKNLSMLVCCAALTTAASMSQADPGNLLWAKTYGDVTGVDGNDGTRAIRLDSTGKAYVAGYEWVGNGTSSNGYDGHAVKYDSDGNPATTPWPVTYDSGRTYSQDQFLGAAVDSGDNLILGGKGQSPNWTVCQEVFITKLNSAGVQQWRKAYGPYATMWDCWHTLYSVDVDGSDSVLAVGSNFTGWGTTRYTDWIVFKLDAGGNLAQGFPVRYNHKIPTTYELNELALGVAADGDGDFIVTGTVGINANGTTDRADDDNDWHVRKYEHVDTDADMVPDTVNLLWSDTYSGPTSRNDAAQQPVVDSSDDIIVAGYLNKGTDNSTNANNDWLIIKYAKDGNGMGGPQRLWTQTFESAAGRHEGPGTWAIVVDEHDNVYIGGAERDASSKVHWRLEYRDGADGNLLHEWVWDGFLGSISGLALRDGRLAITGNREVAAGNNDWYTEVYTLPTADAMLRDKAAIWAGVRKNGSLHTPSTATGVFTDVDPGDYAADWIEQIAADMVTEGCGDGTKYCPKDPVTKAQGVKLILKAAGYAAASPAADPYPDVSLSHPEAGWVEQAKLQGITTGCGDGTNFCPDEVLTEQGFHQIANGVF